MQRLRVAVVFGGRSVEHDVSIVTAHQVMAAISDRHDVVPVYVTRDGVWLTGPELNDLAVYRGGRYSEVGKEAFISPVTGSPGLVVGGGRVRGPRPVPVDVVIPAIHGTYGEDGTLQGLLELAGLPYTGSGVVASAVGMDKIAMKTAFRGAGLPVVDHVLVHASRWVVDEPSVVDEIESRISYPVFVKPAQLGSSVGIGRAGDRDELRRVVAVAAAYDGRVLVEPSKDECAEINCSVLGGGRTEPRVSVCEEPVRRDAFLSFEDKYLRSAKADGASKAPAAHDPSMAAQERLIPAPISDELTKQVQTNALDAYAAIGASGVARVDAFVDPGTGESWVMEINTIPGSFSFYLWERSGIAFPDLMDRLLEVALEEAEERNRRMFTFDSNILARTPGGKSGG